MKYIQIGIELVLLIEKFQRDAQAYQRELNALEKRTTQAARQMLNSFAQMQGADDGFGDLRRSILENQVAMETAGSASTSLIAKLGMLGASAGLVTGTFAIAGKAIRELIESGEQAAQLEDIRRSYISLAAASGISAERLLADLQRVSRGTVDTATLMKTANRALLAGGGQIANELPRLYQIAAAAAQATGQDVDYVFTTLIRGISKGSSLLIDNAEVYIKIGNAVDRYAASLGKTTEQLTEHEMKIATLNAVLEKGNEFISAIGANVAASITPYRQLQNEWKGFSDGLKTLVAPAADYVVKSLNGLLLALKTLTAGLSAASKVVQDVSGNFFNIAASASTFKEEFKRSMQILQTGMLPVEDAKSTFNALADAENEAARQASVLQEKLGALEAQRAEKLADIEKQMARQLEDIEIQRARQLEDANKQLARQLEDAARESARRRADIERDKNRRLSELDEQQSQAWIEHERDAIRRREELERRHQDALADIKRLAWDNISEAARRNDAVEVARAMREQAISEREEKIKYQREQRDLNISEEQKRQDLLASLAQRRADILRDYEQRLIDLALSEQQQNEQLRISLQRQAEDRAIAWQRQDEDFQRNKARRLADLDDWYAKEREKLGIHLDAQTNLAVEKVIAAGDAIAEAAGVAMEKISARVLAVDQIMQRGNYLGGYQAPSTTTTEAWRNRHHYFSEGGALFTDRPTTITMGEAGRELGIFIPEHKFRLALTGRANIGFDGLPAGLSMPQVQDLIYRTIASLIMNSLR